MLIPIRTDNRLKLKPVVNYAIIAANVLIFLPRLMMGEAAYGRLISGYMLHPAAPQLHQFFSSMFLHAGWSHIGGNMLFLWVFGNAVNDKFGHVAYAAFYLAGGVLSGLGYVWLSGNNPVLGASGAIAGVTGAYLVLFPRVRVTLLAWLFYYMFPLEVSSLYFLGFQVLFNFYASVWVEGSGVAYVAHSAGYAYGIGIAAALLAVRLLPRDVYDLLSLWKSWRRRATYRQMVSKGYDPFRPNTVRSGGARAVETREVASAPRSDTADAAAMELRRKISQAHGMGDLPAAASAYLELLNLADEVVLPRQQQLDVSNQLMTEQRYSAAADAYERLLRFYPNYEHAGDIRLMLGIIYGRYLQQRDRAEQNLRQAVESLHDRQKVAMAQAELNALG